MLVPRSSARGAGGHAPRLEIIEPAPALRVAPRPKREPEDAYEWKRLGLSLGAQLIAELNTTMRVDSETLGTGTEIDLEEDFDIDESLFLGRIDANWRIGSAGIRAHLLI